MSQTQSTEGGILGKDVLKTVPQLRDSLGLVLATTVGRSAPLGASVCSNGVNFSLYSRDASAIDLLFFDHEGGRLYIIPAIPLF